MKTASEIRLERRLERKAAQYPRIVGMALPEGVTA